VKPSKCPCGKPAVREYRIDRKVVGLCPGCSVVLELILTNSSGMSVDTYIRLTEREYLDELVAAVKPKSVESEISDTPVVVQGLKDSSEHGVFGRQFLRDLPESVVRQVPENGRDDT
jgi:LPS sulfotransferase NodH